MSVSIHVKIYIIEPDCALYTLHGEDSEWRAKEERLSHDTNLLFVQSKERDIRVNLCIST